MEELRSKNEILSLTKSSYDSLKEETDKNISQKRGYDAGIFAIILLIIGWIVYPFSIKGNQIIGVCLILTLVWFFYFFIFFSIPRSRGIFRTTKKHFDDFRRLSQKKRDKVHDAIDRATPHLSKQSGTTSIMFYFIFGLFIIVILSPYLIEDITINILTYYPIMTLVIFLVLLLYVGVLIKYNRSLMGMHRYEKIVEKRSFTDKKTQKIIDRFNLSRYAAWWFVIGGNIPTLLVMIILIYIIIKNFDLFNIQLNIVIGLAALMIVSVYLLRKRYSLLSKISLGTHIQNNLLDLKKRIETNDIHNLKKINKEYDKIMMKDLAWMKKE